MMKQIQYPSRGQTIYGFLHVPARPGPGPALILCHGFTGSSYEDSRLFVHFANAACAQGFSVLRMDFLGSGNSDADFCANTYLSGWVDDLLAGVDFLAAQPEVNPARVGVLGISFGAAAALTAGVDARIRAVAGWAPVIHPAITFRGILGEENWRRLAAGSPTVAHSYAGARFAVGQRFYQDTVAANIPGAVKRYGGKPLLLLQGDRDDVIDPSHPAALARETGCEFHLIPGEDHSFCVRWDESIRTTLDFFAHSL